MVTFALECRGSPAFAFRVVWFRIKVKSVFLKQLCAQT